MLFVLVTACSSRYVFLCGKWFAADLGDGKIDRLLPVAGEDNVLAYKYGTNVSHDGFQGSGKIALPKILFGFMQPWKSPRVLHVRYIRCL